jgi:hypothetical protein
VHRVECKADYIEQRPKFERRAQLKRKNIFLAQKAGKRK